MADAVLAIVCGGIVAASAYAKARVERQRDELERTPGFASVAALARHVRTHGQRAHPAAAPSAYLSLDAVSATSSPSAAGVIVRDCETSEVSEIWTSTPDSNAAQQQTNPPPPGGPAVSPEPVTKWVRSERERVTSTRANNREVHSLLLMDASRQQSVTVNPHSLQRWLDRGPGHIWTTTSEQFVPLSLSEAAGAALLQAVSSGLANGSDSGSSVPPSMQPRVLGYRHKRRELREGEPIFALGEVTLTPASEGQPDSLVLNLELRDGRLSLLRGGTRQAYLDSLDEDSLVARRIGWFFGGIGAISALHFLVKLGRGGGS